MARDVLAPLRISFAASLLYSGRILLAWLLLIIRVRYLVREVRMRADERADERIRIARELHDTLLEGVQRLLLSVAEVRPYFSRKFPMRFPTPSLLSLG